MKDALIIFAIIGGLFFWGIIAAMIGSVVYAILKVLYNEAKARLSESRVVDALDAARYRFMRAIALHNHNSANEEQLTAEVLDNQVDSLISGKDAEC